MKSKTISQAVRGQKTWIEYERQDLRHLDDQELLDEEEIINACDSQENAISLIHKNNRRLRRKSKGFNLFHHGL